MRIAMNDSDSLINTQKVFAIYKLRVTNLDHIEIESTAGKESSSN